MIEVSVAYELNVLPMRLYLFNSQKTQTLVASISQWFMIPRICLRPKSNVMPERFAESYNHRDKPGSYSKRGTVSRFMCRHNVWIDTYVSKPLIVLLKNVFMIVWIANIWDNYEKWTRNFVYIIQEFVVAAAFKSKLDQDSQQQQDTNMQHLMILKKDSSECE